jgi:hypothetical protein
MKMDINLFAYIRKYDSNKEEVNFEGAFGYGLDCVRAANCLGRVTVGDRRRRRNRTTYAQQASQDHGPAVYKTASLL